MGAETPNTTVVQAVPTPANPAHEHTGDTTTVERMKALTSQLDVALERLDEAKADDTAAVNEQRDALKAITRDLDELKTAEEGRQNDAQIAKAISDATEAKEAVKALIKSDAHQRVGSNAIAETAARKGSLLAGVMYSRSPDAEEQAVGKAILREMGVANGGPDASAGYGGYLPAKAVAGGQDVGKATLGTSDATGQFIVPNNLVDEFIRPAMFKGAITQLTTAINGVTSNGVDIPFRNEEFNTTARATVAAFGSTKENVNLVYDGYTATMYTLARIYDIGKQFARQSQGAAEQDVLSELADGFARGVSHYAINGSGASEPYGLITALNNAANRYDTTFTAAATLAGSVASGIATAAADLGERDVDDGLSALVDPTTYWLMLRQGADAAGFYFNPAQGPTAINVPAGTLVSPFGIPVLKTSDMIADEMIVGQFGRLKIYYGENFRVDSSDVANTRWDQNLIGFRGEQEMGLDARPVVYAGYFQLIEDIVP
jgi:HK97 family phage major capsid protein